MLSSNQTKRAKTTAKNMSEDNNGASSNQTSSSSSSSSSTSSVQGLLNTTNRFTGKVTEKISVKTEKESHVNVSDSDSENSDVEILENQEYRVTYYMDYLKTVILDGAALKSIDLNDVLSFTRLTGKAMQIDKKDFDLRMYQKKQISNLTMGACRVGALNKFLKTKNTHLNYNQKYFEASAPIITAIFKWPMFQSFL